MGKMIRDVGRVVMGCVMIMTILNLDLPVYGISEKSEYEFEATELNGLGLFQGTGQGFELDREPTRAEAIVMLVRLLGREGEANESIDRMQPHPFNDVPEWANPHVSYAYNNGYTNGISATEFGSMQYISANEYCTFILRALGYDDDAGDFAWYNATDTIQQFGLATATNYNEAFTFLRGHVADISYHALSLQLKDNELTLLERLVKDGAILLDDVADGNDIIDGSELVLPIEAGLYEGWYTIKSEMIKQVFPNAHYISGNNYTIEPNKSEVHVVDEILITNWKSPMNYSSIDVDHEFYIQDGGISLSILFDGDLNAHSYMKLERMTDVESYWSVHTSLPDHIAALLQTAERVSQEAIHVPQSILYVDTYEWTNRQGELEVYATVKFDRDELPEQVRHFTHRTQSAYPFRNGRPEVIGEKHSVDYYIFKTQRSLFSHPKEMYSGFTWEYSQERGLGHATYSGQWSLFFEFLLNEQQEIVGYFYFTAEDMQAWADKAQNALEKRLEEIALEAEELQVGD